jgi:UDP-glucuronate 4-epimerase
MKILVTGAAGFIGSQLIRALGESLEIVGIDNINDYYTPRLKHDRLISLGFPGPWEWQETVRDCNGNRFIRMDINDPALIKLFASEKFDMVIHLAAQAGVRNSRNFPESFMDSNISGFFNILENCRHHTVKKLFYASSSSVYGLNKEIPFREDHATDQPANLYGATKKSGEVLAFSYSHQFGIPVTGLRFFSVYGPWGRPDMAYWSFTENIRNGKEIILFNNGLMARDFTFVDDVIKAIKLLVDLPEGESPPIVNIGNGCPVPLFEFITLIENITKKKAIIKLESESKGEIDKTWANIELLAKTTGFKPQTSLETGMSLFHDWYCNYIS